MNNKFKKLFIILSGPSGCGKTFFLEKILKAYPQFTNTITYTTRPPRKQEKEGQFYYFISNAKFDQMNQDRFFVEWAQVHGERYATAYNEIEKAWEACHIVKDLDIQGAKTIKETYSDQVKTIFIYPPSIEELKQRMRKRGQDEKSIEKRLASAEAEMAEGRNYDFKVINDDPEKAWVEIKKIIEKILAL